MGSSSGSRVDNLYTAFDARVLDAVKGLDNSRLVRELENTFRSLRVESLLDQQRSVEQWARESTLASASVQALLDDQRRFEHSAALVRMNLVDVATSITGVTGSLGAEELHRSLSEATKSIDNVSKWAEIQQSIAGRTARDLVLPWDDIKRLADTMAQEVSTVRQLSRFCDFDRALGAIMLEPSHAAWSIHLRTTALPTLSFLTQEWLKPFGLMTDLGSSVSGASISWLTRYTSEAVVMTAAITPETKDRSSLEVVIEEEIACAVCGGPMLNFDGDVRWIGPRRAVRQRLIFPTCSTCFSKESQAPGFLYRALRELTRPRFAVLRGSRQGDGRPRGRLHLVRNDDERDER